MKVTTINTVTGEKSIKEITPQLLPPAPDKCQTCGVAHEPEYPHNQQSIYYQYAFYYSTKPNRWPTWADAMAHCSDKMKAAWTEELKKKGIEV
jgi:hypothetical protein